MKKRIMAFLMAAVMVLTVAYFMPANAEDYQPQPGNVSDLVREINADKGNVEAYTWTVGSNTYSYINQVLGGTGSYWNENHSFLMFRSDDGEVPSVYCAEPTEPAPTTSTVFTEVFETDFSTAEGKKTMKYQGIMPFAYSGGSGSANAYQFFNIATGRDYDYGGTYGVYVIDGVAKQGLMVAGAFYEMTEAEAAAVCAAAIHKVSGSDITSVESKVDASHTTSVNACFEYLVEMAEYVYNVAVTTNSYWEALDAGNQASQKNKSMTYTWWVKKSDGTWQEGLPSGSQSGNFDWSPYKDASGNVELCVRLTTTGMETQLLKADTPSGTSGNITYSHTSQISCNFDSSKNGYYDYFNITEGDDNTIKATIEYKALSNENVNLIDPVDNTAWLGNNFYQDAYITVKYDDLASGKILDLDVTSGYSQVASMTNGELFIPVGRVFRASGYQDVVVGNYNQYDIATSSVYAAENLLGDLQIEKKSANEEVTDGNDCYSLEGAVYCLYKKYTDAQADTNRVASITTDADGKGSVEDLPIGTYYIKEVTPPPGYALDLNIYTAKIEANVAVSMSFTDYPQMDPVAMILRKQGDDGKFLEGAEFTVKFYEDVQITTDPALSGYTADKTWVLKSNSNGYCDLSDEFKISGDDFYYGLTGSPYLPLGTVTIQETKAPEGYILDDTVFVRTITSSGTAESVDTYNAPTITNNVEKQAFQIVKMGETASGENPLAGAGFMACNIADLQKDSAGNYIFDETKAVLLTTDGKKEMFTDENGYALSCELPYGTYLVRETTVPENYFAIDDFFVYITEDSDTPQEVRYFTDESFKAYLKIIKKDSETSESILNNSASFKIWSYDKSKYVSMTVTSGNASYEVDTFSTDENGVLMTPDYLMPGEYRIEEINAPSGYENPDFKKDIEISLDGVYETYIDETGKTTNMGLYTVEAENTSIKGQIAIEKLGETRYWDEETKEFKTSTAPLENIEFGIYAKEDILSADGQGDVVFAKDELIETVETNSDGYAASSKKLLPGTYVIKELNTPEEFIAMQDEEVTISADDEMITDAGEQVYYKLLKVTNKPYVPEIHTTAKDSATGDNIGKAAEICTIIDTVYYKNLIKGRTYTVKGILVDSETGEPIVDEGKEVTSEYTFISTTATGSVDMTFTFNSTALEGKSVVVFEDLYLDGKKVATHADIEDDGQTITFPDEPDEPDEPDIPDSPKTGDAAPIVILVLMLLVSAVGIIFFARKKDEE